MTLHEIIEAMASDTAYVATRKVDSVSEVAITSTTRKVTDYAVYQDVLNVTNRTTSGSTGSATYVVTCDIAK